MNLSGVHSYGPGLRLLKRHQFYEGEILKQNLPSSEINFTFYFRSLMYTTYTIKSFQ